jgi:subtilase family serine protease
MARQLLLSVLAALLFIGVAGVAAANGASGVWTQLHELDNHAMTITVALRNQNLDKLKCVVTQVSDPHHANYGAYLSLDQVAQMVAPAAAHAALVSNYFTAAGCAVTKTRSRDFLVVTAPASTFAALFATPMHAFVHVHSGRRVHRSTSSETKGKMLDRLPAKVAQHVELITGLDDFPDSAAERRGAVVAMTKLKAAKAAQTQLDSTTTADAPKLCAGSAAPEIQGRIFGGEDNVVLKVKVWCQDGSNAFDGNKNGPFPCLDTNAKDRPDALKITVKDVNSSTYPAMTRVFDLRALQLAGACDKDSVCTLPPIELQKAYHRVALRAAITVVEAGYPAGDREIAVSHYPTTFAPSPAVLPADIHKAYNVPAGLVATNPLNSQAVTAFEEQYISTKDLFEFQDLVGLKKQKPLFVGPNDESQPGGESTLDIQAIMGVAPGANTTFCT